MAVLQLLLLLQVGLVLGSSHAAADWSRGHRQLAQLRAQQQPQSMTEEAHLPRVVTAFLRTGDSATLQRANCSRRYELPPVHAAPHRSMSRALDSVLHATNFLSALLQNNRSREQHLRGGDLEWYHALVRSILEGDDRIHRAVVTFAGGARSPAGPPLLLQATRSGGEVLLHEMTRSSADTEWYHEMHDGRNTSFHKRLLSHEAHAAAADGRRRAHSFIPDRAHVRWSAPYLDCEHGSFVPRWLLTLSAAFYGLKSNLAPEFR